MRYFGTDGIRGTNLTKDFMIRVGKALRALKNKNLIIGCDTRESSNVLVEGLIYGAISTGINVKYIGVATTPAIMYLSEIEGSLGISVTASHNPYYYNGIKVINCGKKINDLEKEKLEELIENESLIAKRFGRYKYYPFSINRYIKFLKKEIERVDLKICVDSANGAAYKIAKKIYKRIAPKVLFYSDEPNGKNINDNVGSTNIEFIRSMVKVNNYDYGITLDGDGDRVKIVDNNNIYNGDLIALIIAKYLKTKGLLKYNTVVLTKYSNLGILKNLRENNIDYIITDVGDSNVSFEINKNDLSIGAEESGHVIISDILKFGDGILTSLIFFKILKECNYSLDRFMLGLQIYPEEYLNITNFKNDILDDKRLIRKINELNNDQTKVILRKSGTENILRLYVSAADKDIMNQIINEIKSYLEESE